MSEAIPAPLGQEAILEPISRAIRAGRPHHAYMIAAQSLEDGRRTSLWIAAALNCETSPGAPCGVCSSCRRLAGGVHPDMLDLEPDGRFIKVAQVRELVGQLSYQRHDARYRIARILGAELMRAEAANALLKSLEEPPEGTVFLVATAREAALLTTVRSRCQALRLGPVPTPVLERFLMENGAPPDQAKRRARAAHGSVRRAEELRIEDLDARAERLRAVLEAWHKAPPLRLQLAADLATDKEALADLVNDLFALCRDVWTLRSGASVELPDEAAARLLDRSFPGERLDAITEHLERYESLTLRNVQTRSIVETLLLLEASRPRS